jgi:hypothetical protein
VGECCRDSARSQNIRALTELIEQREEMDNRLLLLAIVISQDDPALPSLRCALKIARTKVVELPKRGIEVLIDAVLHKCKMISICVTPKCRERGFAGPHRRALAQAVDLIEQSGRCRAVACRCFRCFGYTSSSIHGSRQHTLLGKRARSASSSALVMRPPSRNSGSNSQLALRTAVRSS